MKREYKNLAGLDAVRSSVRKIQQEMPDHRSEKGAVDASAKRKHPARIPVLVESITQVSPSAKCIRLRPAEGTLPYFRAGQYINVQVCIGGVQTSRSYSLSSSPCSREYYEITVRYRGTGFVSAYLYQELRAGDRLTISCPDGTFYYQEPVHGKALVFIAGGSGITPLLSILRYWADKGETDRSVDLFYGSLNEDDILYYDLLKSLTAKLPRFRLHTVISEPARGYAGLTGFITAELIQSVLGGTEGKRFFVCGPQAMYGFAIAELGKLGVRELTVSTEVQSPPARPWKLPGWPADVTEGKTVTVQIEGGPSFVVSATEPLLSSLERNGVALPNRCRAGECGWCRTKLVSGRVFYPATVNIRKADVQFNYIHPCMTYPVSDIVIRLHT